MKLYQEFINKVEKFIPEGSFQESNKGEIENLLENPQFRELLENSPAVVGIFNNVTMGYEYMSSNVKHI